MKRLAYGFITAALLMLVACNSRGLTKQPVKTSMKTDWTHIDSLAQQGLYQSALDATLEKLSQAQTTNDQKAWLKSMLYAAKFHRHLDEQGMLKAIGFWEQERIKLPSPYAAVASSLLAELYQRHYEAIMWTLRDRTYTGVQPGKPVELWAAHDFLDTIGSLYLSSLRDGKLEVALDELGELIQWEEGAQVYAPTLKEFLTSRAITFLSQGYQNPIQEAPVYLESEEHFAPASQFVTLEIAPKDRSHQVLQLFQDMIKSAILRKNVSAQLRSDLQRLEYVHAQSIHPEKEKLYEHALHQLWQEHQGTTQEVDILWPLAQYAFYSKNYPDAKQKADQQQELLQKMRIAVSVHPDKSGQLGQLIFQLTQPHLNLQMEQVYVPGQKLLTKIIYRNLKVIPFRLMTINESIMNRLHRMKPEEVVPYLQDMPTLLKWETDLPPALEFEEHSTEIGLDALPPGNYLFSAQLDDMHLQVISFQVTTLAMKYRKKGAQDEWIITHRESGLPIQNAEVRFHRPQYREATSEYERILLATVKSDQEGRVVLPQVHEGELWLEIRHDGEIWSPLEKTYVYRSEIQETQSNTITQVLTDRAIYRPGQVVHFKALVYKSGLTASTIIPHEMVELQLMDANGEMVQSIELKTNAYGSVSGSFILPASGRLLGGWSIQSSLGGFAPIQVEAYKRPTFELLVDTLQGIHKLNDLLTINGTIKSLSGITMGGAKIRYEVKRSTRHWYDPWLKSPFMYQPPEVRLAAGEVKCDDQGRYSISFTALPDRLFAKELNPTFVYTLVLTGTDITGESQSAERRYALNYAGVTLVPEGPEMVTRWPAEISIKAQNLEGLPVDVRGSWRLYGLQAPAQARKARLWPSPDKPILSEAEFNRAFPHYNYTEEQSWKSWPKQFIKEGEYMCGKQPFRTPLAELRDGAYYLEYLYVNAQDTVRQGYWFWVDVKQNISLVPLQAVLGWRWSKAQYQSGEIAMYTLRSAWPHIRWQLELEEQGRTIRQWYWRDNEEANQQRITVSPHQVIRASAIYQNRFYHFEYRPDVVMPAQKLDFEFVTFRHELAPGDQETWKVKIVGQPKAELLTVMYDDALDAIYPLSWPSTLLQSPYFPGFSWTGIGFNSAYAQSFGLVRYPEFNYRPYGWVQWNWFEFPFYEYHGLKYVRGGRMSAPAPAMDQMMVEKSQANETDREKVEMESEEGSTPSGLRQNLAETVFFYPHLQPDSQGIYTIPFTMYDALTRWNWSLFAHTNDLKTGLITQKIVTRKSLMVTPNMPRIAYQDDRIVIPVRINNLTEEAMSIEASVEVLDPLSGQSITRSFIPNYQSQSLVVPAGGGQLVEWSLQIPENQLQPVQIRFWAKSAQHTDGEERTLVILSKKVLLTESKSLWTNPGESKTIDLQWIKQIGNKTPHRLTVEYTPQPVWLALQALPYLQEQNAVTTDALIHKWMAMVTGRYLFTHYPQIKSVVQAWKQSGNIKSPLEQNEELKNVLLSETPWVMEGKDQTQTIQELSKFLDPNLTEALIADLASQIQDRITAEGGLTWYPGGRPSTYITARAVEIWGWLIKHGVVDADELIKWVTSAMHYLDQEALKKYNKNAQRKDYVAQEEDIHYLYLHHLHPQVEWPAALTSLKNQLYTTATKHWTQYSVYTQSVLGLAASAEQPTLTQAILASLKERAINHLEMGLTWKHSDWTWWYQQPIESQVMAIEFLKSSKADGELIQNAQKWLIKQKETQHWANGRATVMAILSLINEKEGPSVSSPYELHVGQYDLAKEVAVAGTGYVKKSWDKSELNATMDVITLQNKSTQPGWGGAYLQYWTEQDQVTNQGEGLKINRTYFLLDEHLNATQLTTPATLKLGDRVRVILTVTSDRAMDYVAIKDLRAGIWEPLQKISDVHWRDGLSYYQSINDVATWFYLDYLPKGTFVLEYDVYLNNRGDVHGGFTYAQSLYAPKFYGRTSGTKLITLPAQ